ncbi:putative ethanolamine kinase A [Zancudomyces culisetae]|uniref:ethanolamine kinase n=1 Tax=Zancudomyces culisetae TaxID=1213189 RepID=A0A1R1PLU0_ZANCU|nr:putative ethanolamine kinase A [Zancudomyces culisetae]|eukprot:OMH81899.1 putative ethanolamine kinase A [Zancudomyces culisetae]
MAGTEEYRQQVAEILSKIAYIDYQINPKDLFNDAKVVIQKLFNEWDEKDLVFTQLLNGITNKLIKCENSKENKSLLIRVYGFKTESIINREKELVVTTCLSQKDLAEKIYGRFKNGLVYGYLEGTTLSYQEMSKEPLVSLVPALLGQWHSKATVIGSHEPVLFTTLHKWFKAIPTNYEDSEKNMFFQQHFDMKEIFGMIKAVEEKVNTLAPPVTFCHNDLLNGNIVLSPTNDKVWFIDYEYGGYNYRGYDIANHFNEFAGFPCEYELYPTKEEQRKWLTIYLSSYHEIAESQVDPASVDKLITEVSVFTLASHLYWGLWSLLQASISDINFDYMGYGKLRFDRYKSTYKDILSD